MNLQVWHFINSLEGRVGTWSVKVSGNCESRFDSWDSTLKV